MVRAAIGGVCVGGGVAVGAYSGGWFLLVAVIASLFGIGLVVGDYFRSLSAVSDGELVPVEVDLLDRSPTLMGSSPTLVAGTASPEGDVPFRFQASAKLSDAQVAEVVREGRGALPAQALGTPGSAPVTEHRTPRLRAPAALVAAGAMWTTILLPPSGFWDLREVATSLPAAVSSVGSDERPLWQWYDDALAHVRAEAPDLLNSILEITANESYVELKVYLGGDRTRVYEGRTRGWEVREEATSLRTRDTFTSADLHDFSARDVLSRQAAQLPEEKRQPGRLEISRDSEDIFGVTHPLVAEVWFGDSSDTRMYALPDGTVAPWWRADDLAGALEQVGAALTARGVAADAAVLNSITLGRSGSSLSGSFGLEYSRDGTHHRTVATAGRFTSPNDSSRSSDTPSFRLADVDPTSLTRVRDDAMTRYGIDPVDRATAEISITNWRRIDSDHGEEIVIEVDYSRAHGDSAFYTLSGQPLSG
ncbi:hypothetical protein GCM10023318_15360 [Nocardia callitridis]|uniref:Uncharacterized protein n=2 Tax=Nocardia callitridis TaxID=648753 RepID=A0ABP9K363_9NOCA